jgi:hypothetical protein
MAKLEKARLQELDATLENEVGDPVIVQFNPDTLKVAYANQVKQPEGAGDQRGGPSQLFVGAGTTKMTCQLWFDAGSPTSDDAGSTVGDVRLLTTKVSFFITPKKQQGKDQFVPPGVRFLWGSFQFDGIMESVEESLELFSPEGKPLRASVSIALSQQKILVFPPVPANGKPMPGTKLTTPVPSGKSVQQVAGKDWQSTAQNSGIENPRRPPPGQRLT